MTTNKVSILLILAADAKNSIMPPGTSKRPTLELHDSCPLLLNSYVISPPKNVDTFSSRNQNLSKCSYLYLKNRYVVDDSTMQLHNDVYLSNAGAAIVTVTISPYRLYSIPVMQFPDLKSV